MSFLDQLNSVQREAVLTTEGPVLIIAGAGSGKTRVLTYRTANLIQQGIRPESILALTFTNKAANEMKGRIIALVGEGSRRLWMGTFHSVFARILRVECEHLGYRRNFTIYDADDSLALIKSIMNTIGIPQQQFTPNGIRARISEAKNSMVSTAAYRTAAGDPIAERTALVYEEYQKRLKQFNAMDFDDLLLNPLKLFSAHPGVLERYQYGFRYILVDEFQDTNRVQYGLIRELAKLKRNICVVGDDAQSIYAFRGADIRNILDFQHDYPDAHTFRLEQNYRSTKTILAVADSIIRNNVDQLPKKLWTTQGNGAPVVLTGCPDDREEGYTVVNFIEEETRSKKLDLKDFAVLYRTNAQSRSIEDALRRNGIPYIIVGGVAFYKRKEIKDVLAYLKVVANPGDEENLIRILNVPARSIGETTLEKLRQLATQQHLPLFDALAAARSLNSIAEKTLRAMGHFHDMMRKYITLKTEMSVSELARALIDEIGILPLLKEENTGEALARRENIQELISALSEFNDHHPGAGLEDFLEEVSLVSDVDVADFGHNAVTLLTIHAAKGLEFPVVFITGLEEGLFPLSTSTDERKDMEEERRLMYVAVTRAMQKLYLSYAMKRYQFGDMTYSVKSRFLDEIDQDLLTGTSQSYTKTPRAYRRPSSHEERDSGQYFSDPIPNYEDESQEEALARVGTQVVHESFGKGRIIAIDGRGESARAIVDFESVGKKHLMLKFARLRAG